MSIPTMAGLNTALSGLEASQAAIDTTGENISNANTPGYTEQVVNTSESAALLTPAYSEEGATTSLGTGVDVDSITRVRNQFLDVQYRAQNALTSAANTTSNQLQQVQTSLDDSSTTGIGAQLSSFWSSWSSLANDPTSAAAQEQVISQGQALAQTFNNVSSEMSTVQSQAAQQYATLTGSSGEVEQDASQIATLNAQIASATSAGQSPNELLDARDNLLDDLSGLAQISVTTQSNGTDTVNFGDASTPLVSGTTVTWPQSLTSASGGQLGALLSLSSSSGPIGQYMSSLDGVANQVITSVNSLQPSSPFFSGNSASTIAVAATTSTLQATSSGSTTAGDLAQSIGNLAGGTADQDYAAFVAQVGSGVQTAQNNQTTQQAVLTAVSNQRQSVSGVSLDQEMTNLINYQQAYEASARVMNAMNSTINTLIQSVGGAGM